MLDFRMETFFTLCRFRNYTRAAEQLNITQPAVTQHIQYLEAYYGGKLFEYHARKLELTARGRLLYEAASTMRADTQHLKKAMQESASSAPPLNFGATLTIGEYEIGRLLDSYLTAHPCRRMTMRMGNTQTLLDALQQGSIDFAFVEGYFDKTKYDFALYSAEEYLAVCAPDSPLAGRQLKLEDLFDTPLLIREQGSGTREIFEQAAKQQNITLDAFQSVLQIGNLNVIKQLVSAGKGITFLYRKAAEKELEDGSLAILQLNGFPIIHEFHFVCLKNSIHRLEYETFYKRLQNKD